MFEQNLIRLGLGPSCANLFKFSSSRWSLWEGWFVISKSWPLGLFCGLPGLFGPSLCGFRRLKQIFLFIRSLCKHISYRFLLGSSRWGRFSSRWPPNCVGNLSSINPFPNCSLSYCLLASSIETLPLNDGANPLNTFDGGRKGPSLGGRLCFFFNGDLSKMFLKGFFMFIPIGFLLNGFDGFDLWSFLSGWRWSLSCSVIGWNSSTSPWWIRSLSLFGLRLGRPLAWSLGGIPCLFGLMNLLMTSPRGLKYGKIYSSIWWCQ